MISYYELLGLIKEGKQPDKVKYKYFEYEFHEDGIYINENSGYLNSNLVDDFGDLPLIEEKVIEIIEDKPKQIEKLEYENMKLKIENERLKKGYMMKGDGSVVIYKK